MEEGCGDSAERADVLWDTWRLGVSVCRLSCELGDMRAALAEAARVETGGEKLVDRLRCCCCLHVSQMRAIWRLRGNIEERMIVNYGLDNNDMRLLQCGVGSLRAAIRFAKAWTFFCRSFAA